MKGKTVTTIPFSPQELEDILIEHIRKTYPEGAVRIRFKTSMQTQEGDYHAALPPEAVFKGATVEVDRD